MLTAMSMSVQRVIPVLRIFDVTKAREFYLDYLGMSVDWEHRFEGTAPLYLQVSRGDLVLHLSEHYGDGTPGTVIYIEVRGVREYHAELVARSYNYLRPALEEDDIGTGLQLIDPFGNRIRFTERPF